MSDPEASPTFVLKTWKKNLANLQSEQSEGNQKSAAAIRRDWQKGSTRRALRNDVCSVSRESDESTALCPTGAAPVAGNEFQQLHIKHLVLQEESLLVGRQMVETEDEIKALEDEKLALLDQLVVLEGLAESSA